MRQQAMLPVSFKRNPHMSFRHTKHSRARSQQRSISQAAIDLIVQHADIDLPQARGCRSLQLSHSAAASLLFEDVHLRLVEAAHRTVLIVGANATLVTVMKASNARGRRPAAARVPKRVRR